MTIPHFIALYIGLYTELRQHFFPVYFYMMFPQDLGLLSDALAGDIEEQFMRTTFV